ncbi:hypothetical protein CUU80_09420 [Bifidobacterium scaligerum]|uniref:Uncharacterized protein n=1 Tax=Bifidobacterium scaligerum TaxID=2052656 RepID=A0A2M9HNK0_9BIFI|nr:hypothetical protein CUU80_09420 [Bifidobacterium scaligerum]
MVDARRFLLAAYREEAFLRRGGAVCWHAAIANNMRHPFVKTLRPHNEPLLDCASGRTYLCIPVRVERTRGTPKGGHAMTGFNASAFVSARIISPSSLAD